MNYGENILFLSDLFVLQVTLVNAQISMHANLIPFFYYVGLISCTEVF